MKAFFLFAAAFATTGFASSPCLADTNVVHVAGVTIPVRFPESGLDDCRREMIRQDADRYFKQVDRLLPADQGGTNLVATRSAAMVARNPEFENGFRFEIGPLGTNLVVSETLAFRYETLDNWTHRTNLLSKADALLLALRSGPVALSSAERRMLFRRCDNGSLRIPSVEEASDEEVFEALADIAARFDFFGACLLELEPSSEAACWTLPLRYRFAAGTNDFEKAILSTPSLFADGAWALSF